MPLGVDDDGRIDDPHIERDVRRFEMDQTCLKLTIKRSNDALKAGAQPGPESSIFKVAGTELNQRRWELGLKINGLNSVGWDANPYSPAEVALTRHWLRSRGNSIEGGTSEIQRNIIARHVLGLPKGA